MKKYILTSLMSLVLIAGASLLLTATEPERAEKSSCCTSTEQAEVAQTAGSSCCSSKGTQTASACTGSGTASSCCSSKTQSAEAASGEEVQIIQTVQTSSAVSGCAGAAAASSCTGSSATTVAGPRPGECTKVPAGIRSQQVNNTP